MYQKEAVVSTHMEQRPEQLISPARLWFGVGLGVVIWAVHLVIVYAIQTLSCNWGFLQFNILGMNAMRFVLLMVTVLAAIGIITGGSISYKNYRKLDEEERVNEGWRIERIRFMAISGALLSGLFLLSMLFAALPILYLRPCALFWW